MMRMGEEGQRRSNDRTDSGRVVRTELLEQSGVDDAGFVDVASLGQDGGRKSSARFGRADFPVQCVSIKISAARELEGAQINFAAALPSCWAVGFRQATRRNAISRGCRSLGRSPAFDLWASCENETNVVSQESLGGIAHALSRGGGPSDSDPDAQTPTATCSCHQTA